ncbi:MAG: zinc ribbon domain-containing protein [Actinomycetota bacterium]|nr:zinc ribbon domain-containing protein [Actinomycetota bacterium]
MPVCPECGANNPEGAFTCGTCGGFLPFGGDGEESARAPQAGKSPPGAASEWTSDMARGVPPPQRETGPRQAYVLPTKVKLSPKVIWGVASAVVLVAAVVVVLVLVLSGGSGEADEAIRLVKEYLDQQDALLDSSMFKDWEASGKAEDMEVSALFDVGSLGEEYSNLPGGYYQTKMTWNINLETGSVIPSLPGGEIFGE